MPTKFDYDFVKQDIERCGYVLLSKAYINTKTKMLIMCDKGHRYETSYAVFRKGSRCSVCYSNRRGDSIRLSFDDVRKYIEKEGHILKSKEYIKNSIKLDLVCSQGHEYSIPFSKFQGGQRCPICTKRNRSYYMQYSVEDVRKIISQDGCELLSDYYENNCTKLHIGCYCGNEFYTTLKGFRKGKRCHKCRLKKSRDKFCLDHNFVCSEISKTGYKLLSKYIDAKTPIIVECINGHQYSATYSNFKKGHRCPKCCFCGKSEMEKNLQEWLCQYIDIESNKRFYYDGHHFYEADIYISTKKIVIEFNGLYHHSEKSGTEKDYHLRKTEFFENKDIQVIHVFENEWITQRDIVKSIILNKLGLSFNREYARNCYIKEVDSKLAGEFLNKNHLQGSIGASVKFGLFNKSDELVSLMTLGKCRFNKHYKWEMLRFCHKLNMNVIGGFSKLLNYFIRNYSGSIISYADRRYSNGSVYLKNGFKLSHASSPNYFYFKNGSYLLESRVKYQKHKLDKALDAFDSNSTEWENMQTNGFNRIFDCGNLVFIKE